MSKNKTILTIVLLGLISLAFAQVDTAPPDVQVEVWYYLSPDSAVMEVWGQGDQKPDTDPGEWKEVTLEELHSKDIYSQARMKPGQELTVLYQKEKPAWTGTISFLSSPNERFGDKNR